MNEKGLAEPNYHLHKIGKKRNIPIHHECEPGRESILNLRLEQVPSVRSIPTSFNI